MMLIAYFFIYGADVIAPMVIFSCTDVVCNLIAQMLLSIM